VTSQRLNGAIKELAQGNPGAITVLKSIADLGRADILAVIRARGLRGPAVWDVYKENDRDIESMVMNLELLGAPE